ncbi:MAG: transcription antitermination factor NusB [Raoultibacter sp.]
MLETPERIVKPARRHERTDARRLALQLLYQSEMLGQPASVFVEEQRYIAEEGVLSPYALGLLSGVEENQTAIDEYLKISSENWTLFRMPAVDRSLLRLAVYEMLYVKDVPLSVSINEAVELAKDFGGEDDSPRFVNGILGRIAKSIEAADPSKVMAPNTADRDDCVDSADPADSVDQVAPTDPEKTPATMSCVDEAEETSKMGVPVEVPFAPTASMVADSTKED